MRVGDISLEVEGGGTENDASSFDGLNEEYTAQILTGVSFAPLVRSPVLNTVVPANVWSPLVQHGYPSAFKVASKQLLMCSNSELIQPLPRVPSEEERVNAAAMLPKTLWLEILSYTHRKCKDYLSCFVLPLTNY